MAILFCLPKNLLYLKLLAPLLGPSFTKVLNRVILFCEYLLLSLSEN
ncbi:MAG: hypothetical protein OFPI_11710 [Osedax symbiont Rs2]|nr:MAG: hypothetical protein OFPI_11710 [Osedax symbiont Rs2]